MLNWPEWVTRLPAPATRQRARDQPPRASVPELGRGARLESVVPIPPIAGNVTASFAAFSCDGRLSISVHADGKAWPDLDVLMRGMDWTWHRLSRAKPAVPVQEGLSALSA